MDVHDVDEEHAHEQGPLGAQDGAEDRAAQVTEIGREVLFENGLVVECPFDVGNTPQVVGFRRPTGEAPHEGLDVGK